MDKTKIYLIGSDKTSFFESDIYFAKKIKELMEKDIKLDAVFAKEFEKYPVVKKYCLNHQIETNEIKQGEDYFISILRYAIDKPAKKNLATLISKPGALKLNWFFKQDLDFGSYII